MGRGRPLQIVGAIGTLKTEPAIFTLMVYDPRNSQDWDVVENPFEEGTTTSLSMHAPTKIGGALRLLGVRGVYSSLDGFNLANLPQLILPPGEAGPAEGALTKDGYWVCQRERAAVSLSGPQQPRGRVGVYFLPRPRSLMGNPNPIESHFLGGSGRQQSDPGPAVRQMGHRLFLLWVERGPD